MAMKILDDCIACGVCMPECPTRSISEGDGILYVINASTCIECQGHSPSPQCQEVCPVSCIVEA